MNMQTVELHFCFTVGTVSRLIARDILSSTNGCYKNLIKIEDGDIEN